MLCSASINPKARLGNGAVYIRLNNDPVLDNSFHPKNPGPQTDRVLRVQAPAMEGPTPAMESPRILRACEFIPCIFGGLMQRTPANRSPKTRSLHLQSYLRFGMTGPDRRHLGPQSHLLRYGTTGGQTGLVYFFTPETRRWRRSSPPMDAMVT